MSLFRLCLFNHLGFLLGCLSNFRDFGLLLLRRIILFGCLRFLVWLCDFGDFGFDFLYDGSTLLVTI